MVESQLDTEIANQDKRSSDHRTDDHRSNLTRSNIGAQSMQKLTGVASRAQLNPAADLTNEIQVSLIEQQESAFV